MKSVGTWNFGNTKWIKFFLKDFVIHMEKLNTNIFVLSLKGANDVGRLVHADVGFLNLKSKTLTSSASTPVAGEYDCYYGNDYDVVYKGISVVKIEKNKIFIDNSVLKYVWIDEGGIHCVTNDPDDGFVDLRTDDDKPKEKNLINVGESLTYQKLISATDVKFACKFNFEKDLTYYFLYNDLNFSAIIQSLNEDIISFEFKDRYGSYANYPEVEVLKSCTRQKISRTTNGQYYAYLKGDYDLVDKNKKTILKISAGSVYVNKSCEKWKITHKDTEVFNK